MISATLLALTPEDISDSRVTVETIKAFEVNRIVYGINLEVDLWVRNGLDLWKKVANVGDFIYSCSSTRDICEECCPSNAQKISYGPAAPMLGR